MKETELRSAVICAHCGEKIGECGMPMFYRIKIERHLLNLAAIQRQTGLAQFLSGNGRLAQVMGPDEEMTRNLLEHSMGITICEDCSTRKLCVAQLSEYAGRTIR